MNSVRKALGYTFASNYTSQIIAFVSILVIARLLTPEEIGIYSVAAVVFFITGTLRSYGVNQYLVSVADLTPERLRKANTMVAIVSWCMTALLYFGAPLFADYYGEPALADILRIVSISFLLTPFTAIPFGVFTREMKFEIIMRISISGAATQAICSVALAMAGMSYLSVAIGLSVSSIVQFIVTNRYRTKDIPWGLEFRNMGEVFSFGTYSGLGNLLLTTSEGIPDLVIGKMSSMTDVGMFSRGMGLILIFNRAVTMAVSPVVLPHLSKEFREFGTVRPAYLRAVELHTSLAWPFAAVLFLMALPVLRTLYGDQWDDAVPVVEVLAIWSAIQALFCYANAALVAVGKVKFMLAKELTSLLIRLAATVTGLNFGGLREVAVALVFGAVLEFLVCSWLVNRAARVSLLDIAKACRRSLVVGLAILAASSMGSALAQRYFPYELLTQLLVCAVLSGLAWLAALRLTRHPLLDEIKRAASKFTTRG